MPYYIYANNNDDLFVIGGENYQSEFDTLADAMEFIQGWEIGIIYKSDKSPQVLGFIETAKTVIFRRGKGWFAMDYTVEVEVDPYEHFEEVRPHD